MTTLSVAIITQDGGEVLPVTLTSLIPLASILKEVVVIDNFSNDGTNEAVSAASRVLPTEYRLRKFDTFKDQKNYAVSLCTGDWVLALDDDMALNALTLFEMLSWHYFDSHAVWDFSLLYARGDLRHFCTDSSSGMPTTRMWKNGLGIRYVRDVHEFPCLPSASELPHDRAWKAMHTPIVTRNTEDVCILETSMLKSDSGVRERVARYQRWAEKSSDAGIPLHQMAAQAEALIGGRWADTAPIPQRILDSIHPACFDLELAKGFPHASVSV